MSEKSSTFAAALRSASWSCTANDIKEGNYIRVDTTTRVIIYINNSNNLFQQHSARQRRERQGEQGMLSTSIYKSLKIGLEK